MSLELKTQKEHKMTFSSRIAKPLVCSLIILATTLTSTTSDAGDKVRKVKLKEALAFEKAGDSLAEQLNPLQWASSFVQPSNKSEPCKLPTSQDQLDQPNFRAFWHGACTDGFASGLGRDIAISDMQHVEEIAFYKSKSDVKASISIWYDLIAEKVRYNTFPAAENQKNFDGQTVDGVIFQVDYQLDFTGLEIIETLEVFDDSVPFFAVESKQFENVSSKTFAVNNALLRLQLIDPYLAGNDVVSALSMMKFIDGQLSYGGPIVVQFDDGRTSNQWRNPTFDPNVFKPERAEFSKDYIELLDQRMGLMNEIHQYARSQIEEAKALEKRYFFKACKDGVDTQGIDPDIFFTACDWKEKFREPYAEASALYRQRVSEAKADVARANQMQAQNAQIAAQQNLISNLALSAQNNHTMIQAPAPVVTNNYNRYSDPFSSMTFTAPQVAPLTPSNNRTTCITVGRVTNCQ